MSSNFKPPKLRNLNSKETATTFESWKGNLIYNLTLDPNFEEFIDCTWTKKTQDSLRGFTDIKTEAGAIVKTAAQRARFLDLCLNHIAGYTPISRFTIVRDSTSLKEIFHKIRAHYGIAISGTSILDALSFTKSSDESAEDLYQRILGLVDSCLLTPESEITHHGTAVEEEEVLSPTIENLVTCIWLKSLHPQLPALVKLKFSTQLKDCTISSIREEISASIPELLQELNEKESPPSIFQSNAFGSRPPARFQQPRSQGYRPNGRPQGQYQGARPRYPNPPQRSNYQPRRFSPPSCALCKQAGRPEFNHHLSSCPYLPEEDRRFLARARLIECLEEEDYQSDQSFPSQDPYTDSYNYQPPDQTASEDPPKVNRVTTSPCPTINAFCFDYTIKILLDTGANVNLFNEALALFLNIPINPCSQYATQADGKDLIVVGECCVSFYRGDVELFFEGLVVRGLDSEVLAGIPFMELNDIGVFPSRKAIHIKDEIVTYISGNNKRNTVQRVNCSPIICEQPTTLFPSKYIDAKCSDISHDTSVVIDPHIQSDWLQPSLNHCVDGRVRLTNTSCLPITISKDQIIASACVVEENTPIDASYVLPEDKVVVKSSNVASIKFNPQNRNLDPMWKSKFDSVHSMYSEVFDTSLPGYNGKFGAITASVNIGDSLPPQRRGRIPQYSRSLLSELQHQFDELEKIGVFSTPEQAGVQAEYINPSFLVKKPDGNYRLVTSFGEVAAHNKPTPTYTPSIDSTIRNFGQWKYIIKTDLKKAYFQIPLHKNSQKYCAVVTPFKGVRVYLRAAMGMPGSECALDEIMSRIFGDLIEKGLVLRVADDIYIGADDLETLLETWKIVLMRLHQAGLRLSAPKTEIIPTKTNVLGWIWRNGTLSASPHHTASLSSCDLPKSVKSLRSYIGAYKVVARVLKHCSQFLSPLERLTAGKQSADKIIWSESDLKAFRASQEHLRNCAPISLPSPSDKLWLVTDACSSNAGIAATLFSTNTSERSPKLCSFFSAKLKSGHQRWLPCEIECLAVASTINHFRPLILESNHKSVVLTDSKPVVQAFEKFLKGHFSTSSRMQSFLLAATQNNVTISHIKGNENLLSDFGSRNSIECHDKSCSVCKFVADSETVSVNSVSVTDIVQGISRVPFASPAAWLSMQLNCTDIQLVRKHLQQGTRPLKKQRNVRDIKHLLRVASVNRDGLLIVTKNSVLQPDFDLIVIPQAYLDGLLTALHIQLDHPTPFQLKKVFSRQFFSLHSDKKIDQVSDSCHLCLSLRKLPHSTTPYSTSAPYDHVSSNFTSDVMVRSKQKILLACEEVTKFTKGKIISDETQDTITQGLKELLLPMHPRCSPTATLKVDPASAMKSIYHAQPLKSLNIVVELGEAKNPNKLATIDKQIQELQAELCRIVKPNCQISNLELSQALANLNSRIRSCGLSSFEQWHRRDQFSSKEIHVSDHSLIEHQQKQRSQYKPVDTSSINDNFRIGSIVSIRNEKTKHQPRPRYIIDRIDGSWLYIRKLTDTQVRAKLYKIHRQACIKLKENTPPFSAQNESDSSDSDDDFVLTNTDSQATPVDHHVVNDTPSADSVEDSNQTSDSGPRYPRRERKEPPWMKDYEKE